MRTKNDIVDCNIDSIIRKEEEHWKELCPAYHLSVVVDDQYQGVTRVTRGQVRQGANDFV